MNMLCIIYGMIAMPSFEDPQKAVASCCQEVGHQLIRNGCPSVENMQRIAIRGLTAMISNTWLMLFGKAWRARRHIWQQCTI